MKAYKVDYRYPNDVDLMETVMVIFSRTVLDKELSKRERTVLREYLLNGYTQQTKNSIKLTLGIESANLNTLNYTLQQKGFLQPHPNNQRQKVINKQLLELKDVFLDNKERKMFIVNFVQNV